MNFSLRPSVQRVGVLIGLAACALPSHAQFNATGAGSFAFGNTGNWTGNVINGVFAEDNSGGVQTITFTSTDVILSFGLTFNLPSSNSLNLQAGGGPYTIMLGGDVSMNSATTAVVTIGSAVAGSELNINLNGARTFTVAANNTISLPNTVSGGLGLTKAGAGALKLTGANTYTGGTTVSAGFVTAANTTGSATGTGTISVSAGATLQIGNGTAAGSVAGDISNSGLVFFNRSDAATYSGVISGPSTGVVSVNGAGGTTFRGANTYTGTTIVGTGDTLNLAHAGGGTLASTSDVSFGGGAVLNVNEDQTVRGLISNFTTSVINIAAGKTFTSNSALDSRFDGQFSGTGALQKDGTGTLIISSDQTFTGTVSVLGGMLQLGNGGTTGSLTQNVSVSSGATLGFNRSDPTPVTYAGIVSGAGSFQKNGSSTVVLTGANTYTGSTNVLGGTLKVGATNALPIATSVFLGNGTTLDVSNSQTIAGFINSFGSSVLLATGQVLSVNLGNATSGTSYAGVMSGGGGLRIGSNNGNGQWVALTGDNTFTGGTTIDFGGSLDLGPGSATGMIIGNVVVNGALNFQRSVNTKFSGVISGSGTVSLGADATAGSPAALALTAANTYTGGTQIYQGQLIASNLTGSATGTGPVTVQTGGFLGGTGTIAGPLNVSSGGFVAPVSELFVPSTLTVGNTTFGGGGKFGFGLINATGVAGTDFGLLSISGSLTITATATTPFDIEVHSLTGTKGQGPLPSFNTSQSYSWMFVKTTGGITGFNTAFFTIDTSALATVFPGSFSIAQNGGSLLLQYAPTAVPEPATWVLLSLGLGVVLVVSFRERNARRQIAVELV